MILKSIIFILIMLCLCALLFFLLFVLVPAVNRRQKGALDFLLSKKEQKPPLLFPAAPKTSSSTSLLQSSPNFAHSPISQKKASIKCPHELFNCLTGVCALSCKTGAITFQNKSPILDAELCNGCGECVKVCPAGVIKLVANVTLQSEQTEPKA